MSFYGNGASDFIVENFNHKPPRLRPNAEPPTLIPKDPKFSWQQNSKMRNKAQQLSFDNPFVKEPALSPVKSNVIYEIIHRV